MTSLVGRDSELLLCQTEDGRTRVEVRFDGDTAWLSLRQMAEFPRDKGYRVKSQRGTQLRLWATAPRSLAHPSVRGPRARRKGPRGARR